MHSFVTAIGTANPPHRTTQNQFADFYGDMVDFGEAERRKLKAFYRYTCIRARHSVLPDYARRKGSFTFYPNGDGSHPVPSVSRRMELFQEHAAGLALEAAEGSARTVANEPLDSRSVQESVTPRLERSSSGQGVVGRPRAVAKGGSTGPSSG